MFVDFFFLDGNWKTSSHVDSAEMNEAFFKVLSFSLALARRLQGAMTW